MFKLSFKKKQIKASGPTQDQMPEKSPPAPSSSPPPIVDTKPIDSTTAANRQQVQVSKSVEDIKELQYQSLEPFNLSVFEKSLLLMTNGVGYVAFVVHESPATLQHAIFQQLKAHDLQFEKRYAVADLIEVAHRTFKKKNQASELNQSALEKLVTRLVEDALDKGTSDLHIEIRENFTEIFFRIYGVRYPVQTLTREMGLSIAGVMFDALADPTSKKGDWSPDIPKDAAINHTRPGSGKSVQIRFASAPIYPGGCVQIVNRLLPMDPASAPPFEQLGYTPLQQRTINEMIVGAQGLVLLVGPTNSGKSTTMQALTQKTRNLRGKTVKIESIEDPVEYLIEGASQMAVSSRVDFGELLKATLRHDPDVLMVGEIRDKESATTIESMVLAGRKVFATLHAFEALAVPQRLMKIGVTEDVLYMNNFLSGVIYQRLLPVLCPHCSIPWADAVESQLVNNELADRIHAHIPDYSGIRIQNAAGCDHCRGRAPGYKGRTVVAEILRPDDVMLGHLRSGNQQAVREYWLDSPSDTGFGGTALGHALSLMVKGLVAPLDVESQVGIIQAKRNKIN